MKLSFDEIASRGRNIDITGFRWRDAKNNNNTAEVDAEIHIRRLGPDAVLLEGAFSGRRTALCDRCGDEGAFRLSGDFVYRLTTERVDMTGFSEIECTEEDAQMLFVDEPIIDIDEILREQVLLALPLQTLCSENCQGICAGCGAGLNHEPCNCSSDNSHSPFAILGKLGKH